MLSHQNSKNIRRRVKILKYIFNIEDSIVYNLKTQFKKSKYSFKDMDELTDSAIDIATFKKLLNNEGKYNGKLNKSFSPSGINIYDYIENATFQNIVNLIMWLNIKLKKVVLPKDNSPKWHKLELSKIVKLRNELSHSSVLNVDDLLVRLPYTQDSTNISSKKTMYIRLIKYYLHSYGLVSFTNIDFEV